MLLTRVLYIKSNDSKRFAVVDAAMNDLLRPSLYKAHHEIVPVRRNGLPPVKADVVGPVCESGDSFVRDWPLAPVQPPGDLLVIAGKGHETGQIVGTEILPFDEETRASAKYKATFTRLTLAEIKTRPSLTAACANAALTAFAL